MKIYIAHSKKLNYVENLYRPIRNDKELQKYNIILPHEHSSFNPNGREFYSSLTAMIAEVTFPGTGMGIELGWAYDDSIPIYCIYQKGVKIASSLKQLNSKFIEYTSEQELLEIVKKIILELEENKIEN